ncbi:uncharacterized protein G2W53_013716 [Senna tora]|uniref:Uncharacterized protein n=1 Tax=Senna tora TaxID=362788 RepID=A0A834TZ93_9FABA|nr:uncharacterized protein G2W53_013716 [Senna tora]
MEFFLQWEEGKEREKRSSSPSSDTRTSVSARLRLRLRYSLRHGVKLWSSSPTAAILILELI